MPYITTHKGIEIELIDRPDGSIDINIKPSFTVPFFPAAKVGAVTVNMDPVAYSPD